MGHAPPPADGIFIWEASPALRLVGLAQLKAIHAPTSSGETSFDLTYLTHLFATPLTIQALRSDAALGAASFLKAGAAGTVFPLSNAQAHRLLTLACAENGAAINVDWGDETERAVAASPQRAMSIKQPWAELILRGEVSVRSAPLQTRSVVASKSVAWRAKGNGRGVTSGGNESSVGAIVG